jgi:hypothetical protein
MKLNLTNFKLNYIDSITAKFVSGRQMKLPVIPTVMVAYHLLITNLGTYLRLAWIPLCICGAMHMGAIYLGRLDEAPDRIFAFIGSFMILAGYVSTVPAITAWHRFLILGAGDPDARIRYSVGRTERAYAWKAILVYIAFSFAYLIIVIGLAMALPSVLYAVPRVTGAMVSAVGWIVGFLLTTGFLLVLPSAAIGRELSLSDSLQAVRGNIPRLCAIYLLAYAPEFILMELLDIIFPIDLSDKPIGYAVAYLIADLIVTFTFFTITISVLSIAYIKLMQPRDASGSAQPA